MSIGYIDYFRQILFCINTLKTLRSKLTGEMTFFYLRHKYD